MLIVSRELRRESFSWKTRSRNFRLCEGYLGKMFEIPDTVTKITVSIHTTPAKERVHCRARLMLIEAVEDGVVWGCRCLTKPIWKKVRKYTGKPLYLEVTY